MESGLAAPEFLAPEIAEPEFALPGLKKPVVEVGPVFPLVPLGDVMLSQLVRTPRARRQ